VKVVRERRVAIKAGGPRPERASECAAWMDEGFCRRSAVCISQRGEMKPEQLEIERLRREVQKLKAERDILKKAAAYFAKGST
jgi:transposase